MLNTINSSSADAVSSVFNNCLPRDNEVTAVIGKEYFSAEVDYSLPTEYYIESLLCAGRLRLDKDIRPANLVGGCQKQYKAERIFGFIFLDRSCGAEICQKKILSLGWCQADHHESLTFASQYQKGKMKQCLVALATQFSVPIFGPHSLIFSFDHEKQRLELGLKLMRIKVSPKFGHLVVLNEALSPIM